MKTDSSVFEKLFEESGDKLFRHVFFRVGDRDTALDIAQDSFAKAWRSAQSGDEIRNPEAFLFTIANNLIIDHYRKAKSSSLDAMADDGFDPGFDGIPGAHATAELSLVMKALDSLEPQDRDVIVMRHIDGLTPGEIAERLGITENAVSVRVHRAVKKLKEIFPYE
jgi:RNA polymerase sigma-70 factor (ECF subfamily)